MGKRVFISSVTEGLHQERTALPGLIRALGMDPLRFEDFTALPEPSRDVCLQTVASSDAYLLLLGQHYGTPFPDTGLSPTHEEYRAALNKGIPRLAFRRRGVTMEPAQADFADEVEAYRTGLFRGSWEEIGELLAAVSDALANLSTMAGQLTFTPVGAPVNVEWLTAPDTRPQFAGFGESMLETYLTPLGVTVPRARLREAGDLSARLLREVGGVSQSAPIDVTAGADGGSIARVLQAPQARAFNQEVFGGTVAGLSVARSGEVCAWMSLRRDHFGAVVNATSLTDDSMPLVVLAGRALGEVISDTSVAVVPSVAISGAGSVSIGNPEVVGTRNGATIPMRGSSVIALAGDESAILSAIVSGARDVAAELAARVEHALRTR
ncbi:MAG: DUF4062 domain-containing protein [Acidimicrobiales bacterium]